MALKKKKKESLNAETTAMLSESMMEFRSPNA